MSVLIKKLKMPKDCEKCDFAEWYNGTIYCHCIHYATVMSDMEHLLSLCPLVEVPTPHGRLIDAEKFERDIHRRYCQDCDNYNGLKCRACWIDDMLGEIEDAPTVLESEK